MHDMLTSNNYDIVFCVIVILSTFFALIRGAVAELINLGVWIIALVLIPQSYSKFGHYIPNSVTSPVLRNLLVFIVIFIALAIIATLLKKVLSKFISSIGLGTLNFILGGMFGIVRGIFICAIIIMILEVFNLDHTKGWTKAKTYVFIHPVVNWVSAEVKHRT
jgi:membrane protein required for colicin V production